MDAETTVRSFLEEYNLHTDPEFRILDLLSEVGELAKDVNTSTDYGTNRSELRIHEDELGDVLFAVYALAEETGIDPDTALAKSIDKYRNRVAGGNSPGSGEN